jgi:hypothetical protein
MERQETRSLKEMSRVLNISYNKARQIKRQIKADRGDSDIPDSIYFNGRYSVNQFKKYL